MDDILNEEIDRETIIVDKKERVAELIKKAKPVFESETLQVTGTVSPEAIARLNNEIQRDLRIN